uniref:Expansin-like protein n=2 Tax=Bursaphelenchus mucronatus TaxID=6325 RepID=B1Q493_BURMU|nr:expansin-like protein [Bursaphelenchus mucronatus]
MNPLYLLAVLASFVIADLITPQLNKPISGGEFTFTGATGRGACGLDIGNLSAGVSSSLFDSSSQWVPSDLPDGRYVLDDPVCKGICVQIEYKGSTAVFPVDNECAACDIDHVNLSTEAFLILEPAGGKNGLATNATITYLFCNSTTVTGNC